ncbi:MAG: GNAT family N-acetyltransferase [Tepidisphaeraceae bacterium]|jgi:GNAT superfamily N-acetyltransferase
MSEPTKEPEPTVNQKIEQFVAAVDRALADSGIGAQERQNVQADLRVQIEEMLSERLGPGGKPATLEDVEAVLAELDPPESYSQSAQPQERHGHHECRRGGRVRWFWHKRRIAEAIRQAVHSFGTFGHPILAGLTPRAKRAISLAKAEAQGLRHDYIGTEHLAMGLILEREGVAGIALRNLGVDIERAREELVKLVPPGTGTARERLPITPRLGQAIHEGRMAAGKLGHDYVGTEHLLLGMLDIPSAGTQIVENLGLTTQAVRQEIMRMIEAAPGKPEPALPTVIRAATAEDVPRVRWLAEQWVRDGETIGLRPISPEVLEKFVGGCFFVAERNGQIVGFACGRGKINDGAVSAVVGNGQRYLEIEDVYVLPANRSDGIGAQLVEGVARWARQEGVRYLLAYSSTREVDRVLNFYRSSGFKSWSVQMFRDLGATG